MKMTDAEKVKFLEKHLQRLLDVIHDASAASKARELVERPNLPDVVRERLLAKAWSPERVDEELIAAWTDVVMELSVAGMMGTTVHECSGGDLP